MYQGSGNGSYLVGNMENMPMTVSARLSEACPCCRNLKGKAGWLERMLGMGGSGLVVLVLFLESGVC